MDNITGLRGWVGQALSALNTATEAGSLMSEALFQIMSTSLSSPSAQQARLAKEHNMFRPRALESFSRWLTSDFPARNRALDENRLDVRTLADEAAYWLSTLRTTLGDDLQSLPRDLARETLKLVGFPVNTLERYVQSHGGALGEGLALLRGAEDLLIALGSASDHPPCSSHYTVWLWNRGNSPITFTGDPQEKFFLKAVLRTDDLNRVAAAALRTIVRGDISFDSEECRHSLEVATHCLRELRQLYQSFMIADRTTGQRPIEPEFFATRMRTYYVSYPVGGTLWGGVNAGNLVSQIQLDYLIGTTTEDYAQRVVKRRLPFLTGEDRSALFKDMQGSSILNRALGDLGLINSEDLTEEMWSQKVAAAPPNLAESARRIIGLIKANNEWAATHYALIMNYLVRLETAVPPEKLTQLPVDRHQGTGGMKHEETRGIMEMRRSRSHPLADRLEKALKN